jgi:hypothetical protein
MRYRDTREILLHVDENGTIEVVFEEPRFTSRVIFEQPPELPTVVLLFWEYGFGVHGNHPGTGKRRCRAVQSHNPGNMPEEARRVLRSCIRVCESVENF